MPTSAGTRQPRLRPDRSEVERLCASTDKARRLLNWAPEFGGLAGFRRGLARTVDWFKEPANLARYKLDTSNLEPTGCHPRRR